jgi:hypothetical protein
VKRALLAIMLFYIPQYALAADPYLEPNCPAPVGVHSTNILSALPAPVLSALREHVPNLAPADAPFNSGDALLPGQKELDRRFLSAFHRGGRWTVAYEAAGIGSHDNVVAIQLSSDMQSAQVLGNVQTIGEDVCTELARWANPDYPVSHFW